MKALVISVALTLLAVGADDQDTPTVPPLPPPTEYERWGDYMNHVADALGKEDCPQYWYYAMTPAKDYPEDDLRSNCEGAADIGWAFLSGQVEGLGANLAECKDKNDDSDCDDVASYVAMCECTRHVCMNEAYKAKFTELGGNEECGVLLTTGCYVAQRVAYEDCGKQFASLSEAGSILDGATKAVCIQNSADVRCPVWESAIPSGTRPRFFVTWASLALLVTTLLVSFK